MQRYNIPFINKTINPAKGVFFSVKRVKKQILFGQMGDFMPHEGFYGVDKKKSTFHHEICFLY